MGIKFHCPNGHKLNVKAFLAGKKGVCPKCGTKVRIPLASEAGLGNGDGDDAEGGDAASVMIPDGNGRIATAIAASAASAAVASPPLPPSAAAPAVHDPIAEAPSAIWYVRPPSGGQYGPARGDVMRMWLSEGRVSSDSFVWRDGWTDWRIAGQLFPNLQGTSGAAVVGTAPILTANTVIRTPAAQTKKRASGGLAVAILAGLALLIVVLLAALAYIVIAFR